MQNPGYELPRKPLLKLSEKEHENAPSANFAGIRRAKRTENPLFGGQQGYATSASEPFGLFLYAVE
jgi:hypothetical protein